MRAHVLVPLIALAVIAQSCCCCALIGGPQPPHAITPSDEAIQRFKERWGTAVQESIDGSFTITVTEEEMTSLVARMLERQQDPPPISDLQVHLRDERIDVYATIIAGESLSIPGLVAFSASAAGGAINVTLEQAAFGPLPIPDTVLETTTTVLNESISKSVLTEMGGATITDIQVGEGDMLLKGTITSGSP
jgi:hypothetical protein